MKKTFNVSGMHCKSCEMLIAEALGELPGVRKVKADAKKGKVEVEYDECEATADMISDGIIKAGFKVK